MISYTLDPDAVLDYKFDWSAWLTQGETITDHLVLSSPGITVGDSTASAAAVVVWVSGGVAGTQWLTCRITTDQGRTDDRTIVLGVRER